MASGHVNRINRPNTWLHRPMLRREVLTCQPGTVHTWQILLKNSFVERFGCIVENIISRPSLSRILIPKITDGAKRYSAVDV